MTKKLFSLGLTAVCLAAALFVNAQQTGKTENAGVQADGSFVELTKPDPVVPKAPNEVNWQFAEVSTDGQTQYYIYNIATKKFLKDDNTLSDEGEVLWTVNGNKIKSENDKYISVWSTYVQTGSGFSVKRTYTMHATTANETETTLSAIEARPNNAAEYYQIGNNIVVSYSYGFETKQTRFVTLNSDNAIATTSSNSVDDKGKWLFISKTTYDIETGAVSINIDDMVDAVNAIGSKLTTALANQGFDKGEYAPYAGAEMLTAYNKAMQIYNDEIEYNQDLVDETTQALKAASWEPNTAEVNAIATNYTSTSEATYTYGDKEGYTMPLNANTLYELSFNTTSNADVAIALGKTTIAAKNGLADAASFKFRTSDAGNYTLTIKSSQAEISNIKLVTYDESAILKAWTPKEMVSGNYVLLNKATGLFVSAVDDEEENTATTLKENKATIFNVTVEDGKVEMLSKVGKLGIVIKTNRDKVASMTAAANASEGSDLAFGGDKNGYTLSYKKSWNYILSFPSHTAYIASTVDTESTHLEAIDYGSNYDAEWILVDPNEYYVKTPGARAEAIEVLREAIDEADFALENIEKLPSFADFRYNRILNDAKDVLAKAEASETNPSTITVITTAEDLIEKTAYYQELSDYYIGSLADIENIEKLSTSFALRSLTVDARNALQTANSKSAMVAAMTALRGGVMLYMTGVNQFADGQDFTGLVANPSFDLGNVDNWYGVNIDFSDLDLTKLIGEILQGDLSTIFERVSLQTNNTTKAVANHGSHYMDGVNGKYYMTARQAVMQPIIGLPAGVYELSGNISRDNNLLTVLNSGHLSTVVVKRETVGNIINTALNTIGTSGLDLGKLIANLLPIILETGEITSTNVSSSGITKFGEGHHRFSISDGDIAVLVLDAGLAPFIGTDEYRADNLRLKLIRSGAGITSDAINTLNTAISQKKSITANIGDKAFNWDENIVNEYNDAYAAASDKLSEVSYSNIMKNVKISDDNALANAGKNYVSKELDAITEAEKNFNENGFIAPVEGAAYNIIMKDATAKCSGKSVQAIGADGAYTMAFSGECSKTDQAQLFSFEAASDTDTKVMRATMTIDGVKYYVGKTSTKELVLVEDIDDAEIFTVNLSTSVEGEMTMLSKSGYFGILYSDPEFVCKSNHILLTVSEVSVPTAVHQVTVTTGNADIYDLSGRKVGASAKGIVIINGKKVTIK